MSSRDCEEPGVGAAAEEPLAPRAPLLSVLSLPEPALFLAPEVCACCMKAAAQSAPVRGMVGETVSVNYCDDCLRHASAVRTRVLAVCLASACLGVTLVLALPMLFGLLHLGWVALLAGTGSSLPVLMALAWRRKLRFGHSSSGQAVFWLDKSRLCFTNPRYARLAASQNRLELSARAPRPVRSSWYWLGPIVTLLALPASALFNTATLRVLNLTDGDFALLVDGTLIARVETTSAESPTAGREFRLGAGARRLTTIARDGQVLDERTVSLAGGGQHLFVPASPNSCFWIEYTSYGRQKPVAPARLELTRGAGFWQLPESVDTWFAPSPLPEGDDKRSSGGRLTALRQARCDTGLP